MFLTSIRALVTRPALQSQSLVASIESMHGMAWALPMLEIAPLEDFSAVRNTLLALEQFDKIIVTSHNAAEYGLKFVNDYWQQLPAALEWYAIGLKTANVLSLFNINAKTPDDCFDSEALLAMKHLAHINNKKILIIKGVGGRLLLEKTLKERGGIIECLETYQRRMPAYSTEILPNLLSKKKINTVICASGEAIDNLLTILPRGDALRLCLIVPSQRIAHQIEKTPFRQVIVANGASDNAMLSVLTVLQLQQEGLSKLTKHSEELS